MNKAHVEWTDRFSDYLDDALDAAERARVEVHVSECAPCRLVLEGLRGVVARAGGLEGIEPTRDLWPGIAAAIGARVRAEPTAGARVLALPNAARHAEPVPVRIALTPRQLAAAAVVLIAVSAATTWWAGPGVGAAAEPHLAGPAEATVVFAADEARPPAGLAAELATLEEVLIAARANLDPNTVRVLERNLAVIDHAITDSRRALALDPENEFLSHHLERVYERKLSYLRDAARVLEWAG